jgi:hypothetical protein
MPSVVPFEHHSSASWTKERERRYQQHHKMDLAHTAKLRAGIAEFRALLEAQYRSSH